MLTVRHQSHNNHRGLSDSIWGDCEIDQLVFRLQNGFLEKDEFLNFGGLVTSNVGTYGGYRSKSDVWASEDTYSDTYSRITGTAIKYKR